MSGDINDRICSVRSDVLCDSNGDIRPEVLPFLLWCQIKKIPIYLFVTHNIGNFPAIASLGQDYFEKNMVQNIIATLKARGIIIPDENVIFLEDLESPDYYSNTFKKLETEFLTNFELYRKSTAKSVPVKEISKELLFYVLKKQAEKDGQMSKDLKKERRLFFLDNLTQLQKEILVVNKEAKEKEAKEKEEKENKSVGEKQSNEKKSENLFERMMVYSFSKDTHLWPLRLARFLKLEPVILELISHIVQAKYAEIKINMENFIALICLLPRLSKEDIKNSYFHELIGKFRDAFNDDLNDWDGFVMAYHEVTANNSNISDNDIKVLKSVLLSFLPKESSKKTVDFFGFLKTRTFSCKGIIDFALRDAFKFIFEGRFKVVIKIYPIAPILKPPVVGSDKTTNNSSSSEVELPFAKEKIEKTAIEFSIAGALGEQDKKDMQDTSMILSQYGLMYFLEINEFSRIVFFENTSFFTIEVTKNKLQLFTLLSELLAKEFSTTIKKTAKGLIKEPTNINTWSLGPTQDVLKNQIQTNDNSVHQVSAQQ